MKNIDKIKESNGQSRTIISTHRSRERAMEAKRRAYRRGFRFVLVERETRCPTRAFMPYLIESWVVSGYAAPCEHPSVDLATGACSRCGE